MARLTDVKDRPVSRPLPRQGPAPLERVTRGVPRYLREVRAELAKVDWPSRQELTAMTIVVIVVLTAMSLYLGAWDFLFNWLFRTVLTR